METSGSIFYVKLDSASNVLKKKTLKVIPRKIPNNLSSQKWKKVVQAANERSNDF